MRLHHGSAQSKPAIPPRGIRPQLRQPRSDAIGGLLSAVRRRPKLRRLRRRALGSAGRRRGRRRSAAVSSRADAQALTAGKHVLVEKPAFPVLEDYGTVIAARDSSRARRPRRRERSLQAAGGIPAAAAERGRDRRSGVRALHHHRSSAQDARTTGATTRRWRAATRSSRKASTGCISPGASVRRSPPSTDTGRPRSREGPDRRVKSMMVSFRYDNGAVGSLYYSREIPSLLRGLRLSKLFGRKGVITFESNGAFVVVRRGAFPRVSLPGFRDIRGYHAMYRDFAQSIRNHGVTRDEPRASAGRPAPHGSHLRQRRTHLAVKDDYDIIIIGTRRRRRHDGARAGRQPRSDSRPRARRAGAAGA